MSLKLKALVLAVFAALAVGAVSVVSAGADSGGVFHSDSDWTIIKGNQEGDLHKNVFSSVLGSITCTTVKYEASVGGLTPTSVTAKPEYAGCTTTETHYPVTVDVNGCAFVLTIGDAVGLKHHTAHLECPAGKNITLTVNPPIVGECTVHIPPQTPTFGGVVYTNVTHPVGGKHNVTIDVTAEGITYSTTSHGFGCPKGNEHTNDSVLEGTITTVATDTAGNPVNVTATTASS